jgi:ABC-type multidrug transport system ATPase subunit
MMSAADKGLSVSLVGATKRVKARKGIKREIRTILDDVTLHIHSGEFIGLLGASGSGKSTLIKAIAGLFELSDGDVGLGGIKANAEALRRDDRVAYMPQDVVIHEQLTSRKALTYTARIKGLGTNSKDRADMVRRALERVGLGDRMDVPIERLSGGQKKRAALSSELLGDPRVILLDEATSGLDPASEQEMMMLFRSLADEGRTVICITHFPNRLSMCDRLIYLIDGKVVFFDKPAELKRIFEVDDLESVYHRQEDRTVEDWLQRFLATSTGATAFAAPQLEAPELDTESSTHSASPATAQALLQFRRYVDISLRDLGSLALQVLQAPVIAAMVALVFGWIRAPFALQHAASTKEISFVLVLAVLWCSGTLGVREIVKERTIFRHESRFGIAATPYVVSKIAFLGLLAILQSVVLLEIVRTFTGLTGIPALQLVVLALAALTGTALGLLVSAISATVERAMTLLPVVLIAQAIMSSGLARLESPLLWLSQAAIPAYWALDGLRASFSAALTQAVYESAPGSFAPPILGTGGPAVAVLAALILQGVAILALTVWLVRNDLAKAGQ